MMLPKQYDSHINVVMEDGKLLYVEHVTANIVIIVNKRRGFFWLFLTKNFYRYSTESSVNH